MPDLVNHVDAGVSKNLLLEQSDCRGEPLAGVLVVLLAQL